MHTKFLDEIVPLYVVMKSKNQTAERVSHVDASDNFVFRRSELAYREAARMLHGDVLEIGTGSGYGTAIVAPHAATLTTVDKHDATASVKAGVKFRRMRVPPLDFADRSFDCVIAFQVVEHIRRDSELLGEIRRVLRPGGLLIISTPNRPMSLTRNPWHIREYTADEFGALLRAAGFGQVEAMGVFGRQRVMEYYENNRRSVARIARFDVLGVQKWLPRVLLRVPYDILNRMNRRRLLRADETLAAGISTDDYYLAPIADGAFDLFYTARKEA